MRNSTAPSVGLEKADSVHSYRGLHGALTLSKVTEPWYEYSKGRVMGLALTCAEQ